MQNNPYSFFYRSFLKGAIIGTISATTMFSSLQLFADGNSASFGLSVILTCLVGGLSSVMIDNFNLSDEREESDIRVEIEEVNLII